MRMSGSAQEGGAVRRLLLVVALVLGIFTMHTLGHPGGSSGSGGHGGAHAASGTEAGSGAQAGPGAHAPGERAAAGHSVTGHATPGHAAAGHAASTGHAPDGHASTGHPLDSGAHMDVPPGPVAEDPAGVAAQHEPGEGMDMTGLCLAVLSVWALAGLLCAALVRLRGLPLNLLAYAVRLLRPNPPPRPPTLAQLSILRI